VKTTIDVVPTDDQEELRATVRRYLADKSSEAAVRQVMATDAGFDQTVWSGLADMGVAGLAVPESLGGSGYGLAELAVVLEEAGRSLLCAPLLSSAVIATATLLASGDDEATKRLLPPLADGSRHATVVLPHHGSAPSVDGAGAEVRLSGTSTLVLDGLTAHDLLVVVDEPAGRSLFAVDGADPGVSRTRVQTLDLTRPMATIVFDGARAVAVGARGTAGGAVERGLACGRVALASEAVGGGDAVLAMAVGYAMQRRQFGRLIGSFQAVKHLCADMLVELEPARAAAAYAARVADTDDAEELAIATAVAKSWCCDAFVHAAGTNIQVHGGIGFTWEHPAHLYLKRAKTNQLLLGDSRAQRVALAAAIGL
jgi:alkylation response protein AidB-like acyl-CoA dehydrogenase